MSEDVDSGETSHRYVVGPQGDSSDVVEGIQELLGAAEEELVAVKLEPLSREQHDANQALVDYLEGK